MSGGTGHHLAIYNFGLHVGPSGDPRIDGFLHREPFNWQAALRSEGFVARSGYQGEPGPESWGLQVFPRFIEGSGFESGPSSLSLWHDLESLMAFTYSGVHADALKNARHWNQKQSWPPLVLWWVKAGSKPDWRDAVMRLEHLADHGPSAFAFTFKTAFDPFGLPASIDRGRVKAISASNLKRQADLLEAVLTLPV
ncbi:DUF3291 domain-containing protein [Rhizobium paknamense]|uniref:DUF3291 domain-containing protein n=1 Tax=Rhizobium paknamense TaxID=1206817 RepID=A0ABU0IH07_9HYPH|nr:DUF3291 domain-containing protein [Rhizobium paknamense]MDQ0456504.1 hypothetical protein [Rhizobium paknamense]